MKNTSTKASSYSQTVIIKSSKKAAFAALTSGIAGWWGSIDNNKFQKGEIFKVSWGEPWYQFKIIEYSPNNKITWECIDANQIIGGMEGVEKEWVGTKLYWTIDSTKDDKIQVHLFHKGLVPAIRCYEVCSFHWDDFIKKGLKNYLEKNI